VTGCDGHGGGGGCRRSRGRGLWQLEAREYRLGRVLSVGRGIPAAPDLDDPVLGWPAPLPPEHRVDVGQVGEGHVRGEGVRGTREIELPAVLVDLVVLEPTKGLVSRENDLAAILPVAVVMLLLVGVGAARFLAAALLEEGVGYALLGLVLAQVLADLSGVAEGRAAPVQGAMVVILTEAAVAIHGCRHQVGCASERCNSLFSLYFYLARSLSRSLANASFIFNFIII
jgi:hypothetical protein